MIRPINIPSPRWPFLILSGIAVFILAATLVWAAWRHRSERVPAPLVAGPSTVVLGPEASRAEVERTCGSCHTYPPPETFPKRDWPREVRRGYSFLEQAQRADQAPPLARVLAYYERRALETLPELELTEASTPLRLRFERLGLRGGRSSGPPGIANVRFVRLSAENTLDVVACDMLRGEVLLFRPSQPEAQPRLLSKLVSHPAHAEVVDLNHDGIKDLLIANLGTPLPSEMRLGSVVWLKGRSDGSFATLTLASELGRVTDVEPADFDGDGDLDLVVASFGRLTLGEVLLLENRTRDWDHPRFVATTLDPRHGAIHVPVADLNGDGQPDFVALISQEHETVVAFLNAGGLQFRAHVIYAAPHPAFGSSGIQLVDLDRDGDLDVLLTNGDTLDSELLRPYHGVQWLENRGSFPFQPHAITALYGVHRAVAADLDGDSDLDIAVTSFLPGPFYEPLRCAKHLDAVIVLIQDAPGHFERHSLETVTCDHATCDLGDFNADGRVDFVTANLGLPTNDDSALPPSDDIILFKNLGPPP